MIDWIERILGVSPDGGSGLTELLLVGAAALAAAALVIGRRRIAAALGRRSAR